MGLTKEELASLREWRDIFDSDNIRIKEKIKQALLENKYIIHVLNNHDLDEDEPDEYFDVNILPYYLVSPTQTHTENFICYDVQTEQQRYGMNPVMKKQFIVFHILCEQKNLIDQDTYLARHDLLAALIMDTINWSHFLGRQIHCVADVPSIVDDKYASRTLTFELELPNNISSQKNSAYPKGRVINQDLR